MAVLADAGPFDHRRETEEADMDIPATLPLRFNSITGQVFLPKHATPTVSKASETDPALSVMTDFTRSAVFSINHEVQIDQALQYMKAVGVRLLFVLNDDSRLIGLITSTDIQGERPTRYLHSVDATHMTSSRADILVRHIMSALGDWIVLDYPDVQKATIGQIVSTFKSAGMRHLVVTESGASGTAVRGVISATRVEQALGKPLDIVRRATTFAEIEHAVAHT
jgi:CBS-domain-containing membrane protein